MTENDTLQLLIVNARLSTHDNLRYNIGVRTPSHAQPRPQLWTPRAAG
jgi:hypothetical protein